MKRKIEVGDLVIVAGFDKYWVSKDEKRMQEEIGTIGEVTQVCASEGAVFIMAFLSYNDDSDTALRDWVFFRENLILLEKKA